MLVTKQGLNKFPHVVVRERWGLLTYTVMEPTVNQMSVWLVFYCSTWVYFTEQLPCGYFLTNYLLATLSSGG